MIIGKINCYQQRIKKIWQNEKSYIFVQLFNV